MESVSPLKMSLSGFWAVANASAQNKVSSMDSNMDALGFIAFNFQLHS
jgi:hypothetical protein